MDIEHIKQQLLADREVIGLIAARAYEIYLRRGERDNSAAEDWLRAESEVLPGLVDQIVEQNRHAIETRDAADPVVLRAAEHARNAMQGDKIATRAIADQSMQNQSTRMAADESNIPNTSALAEKLEHEAPAPPPKSAPRKIVGGSDAAGKSAARKPSAGAKKGEGAPKSAAKKAAAKPAAKKGPAKTTTRKPPASE
jgi:nucleoid-associated protein YgaU